MAEEEPAPEGVEAEEGVSEIEDVARAETPELTELEETAVEMGWTPKDQWHGEDDDWKPAKDFVKTTKDINRSLSRDMKDMRKQLDGIARTSASMTERAVEEARSKWEQEFERAVDEGDTESARKASDNLATLKAVPAQTTPQEGQDFAQKHDSWFGKDPDATKWATTRAGQLAEQGLAPAKQLEIVEREAKQYYPEHFPEAKAVKKAPSVGTPARTVQTKPREKGYATLPPEARKACDQWVAENKSRGSWATPDAWAKEYYQEEAANG